MPAGGLTPWGLGRQGLRVHGGDRALHLRPLLFSHGVTPLPLSTGAYVSWLTLTTLTPLSAWNPLHPELSVLSAPGETAV